MIIKLSGVSVAELESALKYSGLFVDASEQGDYAEIKAIPAFLLSDPASDQANPAKPNNVRCGCDAYRQLAELKDKAGKKITELKAQTEEMGYKVREMAILLGKHELKAEREAHKEAGFRHYTGEKEYVDKQVRLANIEFWERLGDKHGLGLDSSLDLDSVSDFINSEVK